VYFILLFHVTIFFDRNLYSIRSFDAFPSLSFFLAQSNYFDIMTSDCFVSV
jgi:hypothetical protein